MVFCSSFTLERVISTIFSAPFNFFTKLLKDHQVLTSPSPTGTVSTLSQAPPMKFASFHPLKHSISVPDDLPDATVQNSYKFILPGSQYAYLYNQQGILCCSGKKNRLKTLVTLIKWELQWQTARIPMSLISLRATMLSSEPGPPTRRRSSSPPTTDSSPSSHLTPNNKM